MFYLPGLVLLACLFLIPACQKPNLDEQARLSAASVSNPFNQDLLVHATSASKFGEIRVRDGMLVFQDKAHFDTTLRILEDMDHAWVDEVEETEEMVIIPDEALEAFEQMFEFYSLRKFIEDDERAYLESGGEELGQMLDATHHVMDDYLRTVFNPYCEVIIGEGIFKLLPDDLVIEITDGSFETLLAARDYFDNPERFSVPLPEILRQGTLQLHFPDDSFIIPHWGSGSQVEGCPGGVNYDQFQVFWHPTSTSGSDLSVSISDNATLIQSQSTDITASGWDLLVGNVDGSNLTPVVMNGPGYMGNYTHIFNEPGSYLMCLTQRFYDQNGNLCGQESACDTVVTGYCCQDDNVDEEEVTYDAGNRRVFMKFRVRNNWFEHKLKTRTKNFRRGGIFGGWRQDKAHYISAGILTGGGSTIYYKNANGECNVDRPLQGNLFEERNDKKRVTYTYRPGFGPGQKKKFYLHSGSATSRHFVRATSGGDLVPGEISLTDNCN